MLHSFIHLFIQLFANLSIHLPFFQIWRVEDHDLVSWEPNLHGVFFSGDSYVIKYSFTANWRRQIIIYFWQVSIKSALNMYLCVVFLAPQNLWIRVDFVFDQGARSSLDERAASAMLADQMDKNLGGIATQVITR